MNINPYTWMKNRIQRKRLLSSFTIRNDLDKSFTTTPVEIIKGKYKGLIYRYGFIKIPEDGVIQYEYEVLHNGHVIDDGFIPYAGYILTYLYIEKKYHEIISTQPQDDTSGLIKE